MARLLTRLLLRLGLVRILALVVFTLMELHARRGQHLLEKVVFLDLLFHFVVVLRLLYAESLVEIIVADGKPEVRLQLYEDIRLCREVDILWFREGELPAFRIDAHSGEDVGHVIVEHVQDKLLVGLQDFLERMGW